MRCRRRLPAILFLIGTLLSAGGCTWIVEQRFEPKLAAAGAAFSQRDYALAAARYESLRDGYPAVGRRQELFFQLALAYYLAGSVHDARQAFERYLAEYPDGRYADNAGQYIEKIALRQTEAPVRAEAIERARDDERQLRALLEGHPHSADVLVALGNLLYSLGRYDEAVGYYDQALKVGAAQQEWALIEERMMLDESGRPMPVTPEQLDALERDRRPLVVFNTREYGGRNRSATGLDGTGAGDVVFQHVSGMVRNQSSRLLYNVEVEVTYLNVANQVQDVARRRLGTMGPGEVRAFRVQSTHYDSRFNIADYSVTARWDEAP
jgi:tetratricopeptide (TPR) repeat protein